MASAFEQRVTVGGAPRVHVVSAFRTDETRCGLQMVPPLYFEKTEAAPTCPWCAREPVRGPS